MEVLVSVVVALIVLAVVCWIISIIPFPLPWMKQAVYALIGLIFLVWLLSWFGMFGGHPHTTVVR
jgi:uncharacterized membrane protein